MKETQRINNYLLNGDTWLITPDKLIEIHAIANRENDLQAVLAQRGEPLKNTRVVQMRGNVAVIPVSGVLFPKANLFSEISGGVSVEQLMQDITTAQNDPKVKSLILNFDTPGGSSALINEASKLIAQSTKPIIAYVSTMAASGGMWLASAAKEIVVDETAILGSIGVVSQIRGKTEEGTLEIVSSNAPDKRPDTATDEGKAVIQRMVDDMETVFVNAVAKNRNLDTKQVTDLRGGVLIGQKAIQAGLADHVGTLEGLISELNNPTNKTIFTTNTRTNTMDLIQLKTEHPAVFQAAFEEGKASLSSQLTAASATAVTAERERISAIMSCEEAKGRETMANFIAFDTDMALDKAKVKLATMPTTQTQTQTPPPKKNPLEAAMENVANPKVQAEGAGHQDTQVSTPEELMEAARVSAQNYKV
jgi:ClpP class serine protease